MFVSNVCRISGNDLENVSKLGLNPGINEIPEGILGYRQIEIGMFAAETADGGLPCRLKYHRGTWVPVVSRKMAADLIAEGAARALPQRALCYGIEEYLNDPDVQADEKEFKRAIQAHQEGEAVVLVAIIGDDRSPLAVCRNIVSGCQKMETIVSDAQGAMKSANTFLVED
jgi:hypothetical protein